MLAKHLTNEGLLGDTMGIDKTAKVEWVVWASISNNFMEAAQMRWRSRLLTVWSQETTLCWTGKKNNGLTD